MHNHGACRKLGRSFFSNAALEPEAQGHSAPRAEGPDQEKRRDPLFTVGLAPKGCHHTSLREALADC